MKSFVASSIDKKTKSGETQETAKYAVFVSDSKDLFKRVPFMANQTHKLHITKKKF
jgi:hypothetical protein